MTDREESPTPNLGIALAALPREREPDAALEERVVRLLLASSDIRRGATMPRLVIDRRRWLWVGAAAAALVVAIVLSRGLARRTMPRGDAYVAAQVPLALSFDDEIRIAQSAAPAEISKDARVYVLDHDHFIVAEHGHSTVSCMVTRISATSLEPQCGDTEADATVMAIDRFRTEQRLAGHSRAEIQRGVADGLAAGRLRAPTRPALVYMMSSMERLVDPTGKVIGKWKPHVMVYYPNMRESDLGLVDSPDSKVPGMVEGGTALSGLVVVTQSFIDPAPTP